MHAIRFQSMYSTGAYATTSAICQHCTGLDSSWIIHEVCLLLCTMQLKENWDLTGFGLVERGFLDSQDRCRRRGGPKSSELLPALLSAPLPWRFRHAIMASSDPPSGGSPRMPPSPSEFLLAKVSVSGPIVWGRGGMCACSTLLDRSFASGGYCASAGPGGPSSACAASLREASSAFSLSFSSNSSFGSGKACRQTRSVFTQQELPQYSVTTRAQAHRTLGTSAVGLHREPQRGK